MVARKISATERALKQKLADLEVELEDREEENTLLRSKLNRVATIADFDDDPDSEDDGSEGSEDDDFEDEE